jgi:hypothetical protein
MAPQTTKAWISAPQITNCLFFGPICQFVPSKWIETGSHSVHVTSLAQKPENTHNFNLVFTKMSLEIKTSV